MLLKLSTNHTSGMSHETWPPTASLNIRSQPEAPPKPALPPLPGPPAPPPPPEPGPLLPNSRDRPLYPKIRLRIELLLVLPM